MIENDVIIRWLGCLPYLSCWQDMQTFTQQRTESTPDEIWLLEHHPVYTQGQSGKPEHVLDPGDIPIIRSDRGGQVTYHGPGQLMVYTLIDIKRKKFQVRQFVSLLEEAVINFLAAYQIPAYVDCKAPGVYVDRAAIKDGAPTRHKICSVGLRIRRGCSYHGIALNVAMDLKPFSKINPCGFAGLDMTQCKDLGAPDSLQETGDQLVNYLLKKLGYNNPQRF